MQDWPEQIKMQGLHLRSRSWFARKLIKETKVTAEGHLAPAP